MPGRDGLVASPSRMIRVARTAPRTACALAVIAVAIVGLRAVPASADLTARYQDGQDRA